jgi:membrane-bound serine protease (ClpP class)
VVRAQRQRPATGAEGLVGAHGRAATALDPEGWVLVQGERWQARAGEVVAAGDPVLVERMEDGLVLRVRKGA